MIGIRGILIVALMAEIAGGGSAGVLPVWMAQSARRGHVSARQPITRLRVMTEARGRPGGGIVADRADIAEGRRGVNRIVGVIKIGLVTAIAVCRGAGVLSPRVTLRAGDGHVSPRQRVNCLCVMIET